tara:strand:- start:744 stop:1136 length:393 start_codon:yes stop_codon:yes gene_type:complete
MASLLKVDTLTGVTTAGSISVTGEGNSTTTNLQQGLAKAWVQGTAAAGLSDSNNISSGTDNGTGDYTYAFTSNMGNANYGITTGVLYASLSAFDSAETATGSFNIRCFTRFDSLTASDNPNASAVHGDLS